VIGRGYQQWPERLIAVSFRQATSIYLAISSRFLVQDCEFDLFSKGALYHKADSYTQPIDWAQRTGNVVRRTVHDSGGHFAAVESPDALLSDIRSFFGNKTLSHTYVFDQ
jgi:hypothetical protein